MTELLVGTKKGLFVLRGDPGSPFDVVHRAFAGDVVEYAMRDRRSGRYVASVTSGFYGPRLMLADDPLGDWRQASGPAFPADVPDAAVKRIWVVRESEEPDVLYAGTDPAALWRSEDGGESWTLNRGLWNVPTRPEWNPGGGGLCLHTISTWPGEPDRLAVAISAAGVWLSDDRGETWRTGYEGLHPRYLPEDARSDTHALCVHNMHRAPRRPERLFLQFHGGVYRSDDTGETWVPIGDGLPADFGFPLAVDPADPDSAYVIPLVADVDRVTPGGEAARLRDSRRRRDMDRSRRRAAERERVPDRAPPGVRRRRRRLARPLFRSDLGRRVRLTGCRCKLVHRREPARTGDLRAGE